MKLMIKCDLSYFKTRFIILEEPFKLLSQLYQNQN